MTPLFLGYVLLFALATVGCLACVPRAREIQHPGTREGMVGFLLSVALWSIGYLGYLVVPTVGAKLAFYTLGFVFAFVAVGAWLYFCAAYTGRPPRNAPYRNVWLGGFLLFIALKLTNPLHHLYFTTEWTAVPFPHLAIQHQLLYWVLLGLSYAVTAVGFFMLLERFYHTGSDSRPLVALVSLTGVPAVATIAGDQFTGLLPLMYEPAGVALFAIGTLFVYHRRFEAIRLTGETSKPAIFLDQEERVRDYNQAARELFPALDGSIGDPVESVSSPLTAGLSDQEVITVPRGEETRYYEISGAPFTSGEVQTGQLVTITDVTDRETYRQRLEQRTEQLEALNHMVRHDIRNDMAVILGWAESLQDHVSEEGTDALERVLRKSRHVISITENARDFVDSLSGGEGVELGPVPLKEVLEDELEAVRDSNRAVTVRVAGEIPQVSVHANELLSSVFRNLLENAVRHNDKETPEIEVSCVEEADRVRVRIADNGPGIPDEQKARIFGKGEKGPTSTGSGLGLYLVHTLVDQFEGSVSVEDNQPRGTAFSVELKKAE